MGQRLVGSCCHSAVDFDNQVILGSYDEGSRQKQAGRFPSDSLVCNVSQAEVLPPPKSPNKSPSIQAPDVLVKESTNPVADDEADRRCLVSCCGGGVGDTPTSRLVRKPLQPSEAEDALAAERSKAAADAACGSSRCCNSPSSCDESEWNSVSLIRELNTRAASLSLEFAPMPAPGPAFLAPAVAVSPLGRR